MRRGQGRSWDVDGVLRICLVFGVGMRWLRGRRAVD